MSDTLDFHQLLTEAAERLEPLPGSAVQLATIIADPDTGPEEITAVLSTDPNLAGHVLREANSAVSASQQAIGTLDKAVVRIGAARVLEVAVRGQLGGRLETGLELYGLAGADRKRLAVGASIASAIVSAATPKRINRDVVCAALLHGIGMDVIDTVADHQAAEALRDAGISVRQMEHELVSSDHAEVGGLVLRRWRLPATLVAAVEHQNEPHECVEAAVVCLSTDVTAALLFGEDEAEPDPITAAAVDALELGDRLDDVRDSVRAALAADGLLDEDA